IARGSPGDSFSGLQLTEMTGHDSTHYPLTVIVVPGQRLRLRFDYLATCFEGDVFHQIAQAFVRRLEAMAADLSQPVADVETLGREQAFQLLRERNATAREWPDVGFGELFDR